MAADIELFKQHVRADEFADDDQYLQHLLDTAEAYVCASTNRSIDELLAMGNGRLPAMIFHAIMLIGGHWYNQREAVSNAQMVEVPYTLQAMIKPFRKLVDDQV